VLPPIVDQRPSGVNQGLLVRTPGFLYYVVGLDHRLRTRVCIVASEVRQLNTASEGDIGPAPSEMDTAGRASASSVTNANDVASTAQGRPVEALTMARCRQRRARLMWDRSDVSERPPSHTNLFEVDGFFCRWQLEVTRW
jgi:hypothetical protein